MAKKKSGADTFMSALREGVSIVTDVGLNALVGNLKSAATEAMEEAQKRVEDATRKVMKAVAIFCIMIFGLILAVVGFASYLDSTADWLGNGLGYLFIGACLLVLGLIIQFFRK